MTIGFTLDEAARVIQKAIRHYLARKNRAIKVSQVGQGIQSIRLFTAQPSMIFGEEALPLDRDKPHEIMMTRINLTQVSLELVTNQGTSDAFRKYLQSQNATYGAIINGGFYAINGFYELPTNAPIGIHRVPFNASVGKYQDAIRKDFDNTESFIQYDKEAISKHFEDYPPEKQIDSRLHLKTQIPYAVKDQYGILRITEEGAVDIQKLISFTEEEFDTYRSNAKYLMSSGPFLVKDKQITFTQADLNNPGCQFDTVSRVWSNHPGSVPPGTFYHANQLNPRSSIGLNENGELLMVIVKGEEDPKNRDGMTLPQMAILMKLLGAKTALNLDGGYSSYQGIFNSQMFQPLFIKKLGREKLVPCAIVAREKTKEEHRTGSNQVAENVTTMKAKRKLFG